VVAPLNPGAVMFCGTVVSIGGIRPASRFKMELEDPMLNLKMTRGYDGALLPVVL